jgi:hypothetical protein
MTPALASADRGRGTPHRLVVMGSSTDDTVSAIGGLIVDSVRAGWSVEVYLECEADETPWRILGVATRIVPDEFTFEKDWADAVYVHGPLVERSRGVRKLVADVTRRRSAEVGQWGGTPPSGLETDTGVEYRLSAAAHAFKQHAMRASGTRAGVEPTERFLVARNGPGPLPAPLDRPR